MSPTDMNAFAGGAALIVLLITWGLLFAGFAIGMGFIAARLGKSVALWVILTLIPGVNVIFIYYVWFYVICRVLNRLNQIAEKVGVPAA